MKEAHNDEHIEQDWPTLDVRFMLFEHIAASIYQIEEMTNSLVTRGERGKGV
jgi:hypothetical protein